jgi:predicted  nucleic acid-binding Zn-ribbon protein
MVLDLTPYLNLLNVRAKTLDDVHRELEQIRKAVEEFGTHGRGLLVKTPADLQAEREQFEEQIRVWNEEQQTAKAPLQDSPPSTPEGGEP